MFYFIIPRTPVEMRNSLRNDLWTITLKSLESQTSKNWKAIIVGDTLTDELDNNFFITLNFDKYSKREKIEIALNYLKNIPNISSDYLIRLDDDDIFSQTILQQIDEMIEKYDCYTDKFHTYFDLVYLKISYKENFWIPNTAIHKYEHAINVCGKDNIQLLMQNHNEYWHIYYQNKKILKTEKNNPVYYRILTPFSLTSHSSNIEGKVDWEKHLNYLRGYGPWINIYRHYFFYQNLQNLSHKFFSSKPILSQFHWFYNWLKFIKNSI